MAWGGGVLGDDADDIRQAFLSEESGEGFVTPKAGGELVHELTLAEEGEGSKQDLNFFGNSIFNVTAEHEAGVGVNSGEGIEEEHDDWHKDEF